MLKMSTILSGYSRCRQVQLLNINHGVQDRQVDLAATVHLHTKITPSLTTRIEAARIPFLGRRNKIRVAFGWRALHIQV